MSCFPLGRCTRDSKGLLPARQGAIAEDAGKRSLEREEPKYYPGSKEIEYLSRCVSKVLFFGRLECDTVKAICATMYERIVGNGERIITEGDSSRTDEMYVVKHGRFNVSESHYGIDTLVNQKGTGDVFGEMALLYNAPRNASVTAVEDSVVWVLKRRNFRRLAREAANRDANTREVFLNSVPILRKLEAEDLMKLSECLEEERFEPGEEIVRQGNEGSKFYIIMEGEAEVYREDTGNGDMQGLEKEKRAKINQLFRGDFFGEQALFNSQPRDATVIAGLAKGAVCLTIKRHAFIEQLGDLREVMEGSKSERNTNRRMLELRGERDWVDANVLLHEIRVLPSDGTKGEKTLVETDVTVRATGQIASDSLSAYDAEMIGEGKLDFVLQGGRLLGVGASSVVRRVTHDRTGRKFALKRMRKTSVASQSHHVFCEQEVTRDMKAPFCMRQYASFQDEGFIYFLFDYADGCDLMDALTAVASVRYVRPPGELCSRPKRFLQGMSEEHAKFFVGCMVVACQYLHQSGIIYRDMKPENVLIDAKGFPLLGDFGFAKNLVGSSGRTYTFCGTPGVLAIMFRCWVLVPLIASEASEHVVAGYVAPEVILGKGYGTAVDWWGLGVLAYVLLTGTQPFSYSSGGKTDDPMTIMKRIVDQHWVISYPWYMSNEAQSLVSHLLQRKPSKRLGNLANKGEDVKSHAWFRDLNWDELVAKRSRPPNISVKANVKSANSKRRSNLQNDILRTSDEIDHDSPELAAAKSAFKNF